VAFFIKQMKFLVIQTAFIGDVILATPVVEKLHRVYPEAQIDILVRKGNESLFNSHPFIKQVHVWDKHSNKFGNLFRLIGVIRKVRYDYVINLHRFASSGLLTMLSGGEEKIGFDKNPFSFSYNIRVKHEIGNGKHEVQRNLELIEHITDKTFVPPCIYPTANDFESVKKFKGSPYICIAPASVWFTKQFPKEKWIELIDTIDETTSIYLLGSPGDSVLCETILHESKRKNITNLSGSLGLLASAALMRDALVNYVNDSAPLHLASAINAPTIAVFCSTVPDFGFGPLASKSIIVETLEKLNCRPCGLHGKKACPQGHFKCALTISMEQLKPKLPL
jgi:ADP-heptose:LPS heptosyltransferase